MKKNLLFEIIITNQCNKRCPYCFLDFKDLFISQEVIDNFLLFLGENIKKKDNIKVNFFGGEPLLGFDLIRYFVEKAEDLNLQYSIGTNGTLLTNEVIDFLGENNFDVYLSIDTFNGFKNLENRYLNKIIKKIYINFILYPHTIKESFLLIDKVGEYGFSKINIMPIYGTTNRTKENLVYLNKFIKEKVSGNNTMLTHSYFNGKSIEKQFILETNGDIYMDFDSLLWIQKQNLKMSDELRTEIEGFTKQGNINNIKSLNTLLFSYNENELQKLIYKIPYEQGYIQSYKIIDALLKETKILSQERNKFSKN